MKLFLYYIFCTIKNQIRKLFHTWVAIFLLVCIGIGLLIGVGAGWLDHALSDEEITEAEPTEEPVEEWTSADTATALEIAELAIGGVVLFLLVFSALDADKNGCAIFQPADVNILFPSPLKPQSVLLFRLMTKIGTSLLISIYFIFKVPSLARDLEISAWAVGAVFVTWLIALIFSKLLQVLLYTVASGHPRFRSCIRPITLGTVILVTLGFLLYWQTKSMQPLNAVISFFNAPWTRYIPVWGWLKGIAMYAIDGDPTASLLALLAMLLSSALLMIAIRRSHADFYEDAMAKTEETAALQQRAQNDGKSLIRRKKDRADRIRRDGLHHGQGANVYFFKTLYNRFRFAHLLIFTKTSATYLFVAIVGAIVLRRMQITSIVPIVLIIAVLAFFRSLGNPIADDTQKDLFYMTPESPWAKVFWSMAGGTVNCFLDLLPAMLAVTVILGVDPLLTSAWALFIISMDFYSTSAGVFIDLSVSVSATAPVKNLIQILFLYFGLLPNIILLIVGGVFSLFPLFSAIAAIANFAIGAVFFIFSPMFVAYGRK